MESDCFEVVLVTINPKRKVAGRINFSSCQHHCMAFNDIERKRIERALDAFLAEHRPPAHIRPKLDLGYRLSDQSVEILEIRPQWDDESIIHKRGIAKATYVRSRKLWKLFWKRADMKWHAYEPHPTASNIDEVLTVVGSDDCCCFFG